MTLAGSSQPHGRFWFPQIEDANPGGQEGIVAKAFQVFCGVFGIALADQIVPNPLSSTWPNPFDVRSLIDALSEKKPVLVLGTASPGAVIKSSWNELGLDLLDLPWFNPIKAFRYVPLQSLPECLKTLQKVFTVDDSPHVSQACEQASEQLQWARCHQFATAVQEAVGHGNRDRFQVMCTTASWDEICVPLRSLLGERKYADLPCGDSCGLKKNFSQLLNQSDGGDIERRLELAQRLTALDCRAYRLAPTKYFVAAPESRKPCFRRIVILEDSDAFRDYLRMSLKEFVAEAEHIEIADHNQSMSLYRLCDGEGKNILSRWLDDENIEPEQVLACFDLDLGPSKDDSKIGDFLREIFGGYWVMYSVARERPRVPRLIITGFRSQDVSGYAAGGNAYLLKPFTMRSLKEQVKKASILHRVKWLCPKSVQRDYSRVLDGHSPFTHCANWLKDWLGHKRIELEVMDKVFEDKTAESDLIVIDIFEASGEESDSDLLDAISRIRRVNSRASLVVVIPMSISAEDLVSSCYRRFPLGLREGTDSVIKKPMWIVADNCPHPVEALGSAIVKQLEGYDFDIKYQVLVPVAAVIGRCDADFVRSINDQPGESANDLDRFYAPLLPFLIDAYGLSGRLIDVAESRNLLGDLKEGVIKASKQEGHRWTGIREDAIEGEIEKTIKKFIKDVKDVSILRHLSLEAWLRATVDKKVKEKTKSEMDTFTEPLARVFGGATRYEFSVRGSWYPEKSDPDKGNRTDGVRRADRVDDILIVIEFCAKSSIIAREFVEKAIVKYLLELAGESCVLVQEIPVRGYLRW